MDLREFGLYMAKLREMRGFKSQRQLSIASGISNGTIARIESGTQRPKPDTLKTLSRYLGVPFEELMARAGYIDAVMMDDEVVEGVQKGTIKSEDIIKKPVEMDGKIVLKHELKDRTLNLSEEKINEVLERFAKLPPEKQRIIEGMLELLMKEDNK